MTLPITRDYYFFLSKETILTNAVSKIFGRWGLAVMDDPTVCEGFVVWCRYGSHLMRKKNSCIRKYLGTSDFFSNSSFKMILKNVWEKCSEEGLWRYHRELFYFFFFFSDTFEKSSGRVYIHIQGKMGKNQVYLTLGFRGIPNHLTLIYEEIAFLIYFFLTWCFWWNLIKVAFLFVCQHRAWCQSRSVKSFISQL